MPPSPPAWRSRPACTRWNLIGTCRGWEVRPEAQGLGLGGTLLAGGLAWADAEGIPAYLEATNRRNAAFYARYGFEVVGVVKAPEYPEIIGMWRMPK